MKRSRQNRREMRTWPPLRLLPLAGLMIAALFVAQTALADVVGPSSDDCMGTLFFANTGQKLNCTSNDVRNAAAISVDPSSCDEGTRFDLTATFKVLLSGGGSNQSRFDLGLYFNVLGGASARTGTCDLAVVQPNDIGYYQLDPSPDICGDIDAGHNPLFPQVTLPQVLCTGDGTTNCGGQQCLKLPNCTSWRVPGSNQVCTTATDAFPGTSSKCNCDDTFTVPVQVRPASASLRKSPTKAIVTYGVTVTNDNPSHAANLNGLCDNVYGTVAGTCNYTTTGICQLGYTDPGSLVASTDCVLPHLLAKSGTTGDSYSCTFDVEIDAPGSTSSVPDTVTGTVVDTVNASSICPTGSASVVVSLPVSP